MANLCFHFSFSMFSLLCLMFCLTSCHTNFATDELALLAFKFSVSDPYMQLTSWSNSSSICDWAGVTCDAHHDRVRILNLGEMGLKGTLPSQIGNLSFLVELDLHRNNFYGELPTELLRLRNLKILNLSYNAFNGRIPTWIGNLFTLQHLILGNNSFGGVIPPSVSNLSKLKTLDWRCNAIEGSIPLEIGRLRHLKVLQFSSNKLSGSIPPTISNLSSLEKIVLYGNFLEGDIPKGISDLTNLKTIYLGTNKLSGHIPRSIANLTELQELDLSHNNLQGDIPKAISSLTNLKMIYLGANKLSGHIPKRIENLTVLQEFDLNHNKFEGDIPNGIIALTNVEFIDLSSNDLVGYIPKGIGNFTVLQELYLQENYFTGLIPMEIGNLGNLDMLFLGQNKLWGAVPWELFNMSTLTTLSVENNSLSGSLPSDFGRGLSNLEELYLWGNKLSGIIPNTISNASLLTIVALENNKFRGVLPGTLGELRCLENLRISENNFTIIEVSTSGTSFVSSLTKCRQLNILDLSRNPLYIKLPKSIGNLSDSLQDLRIDSSGIHGNLPSEIGNLTNLFKLSLAENVLNGPIPITISSLKALQYLNLEDNELHGLIIDEVCKITRLVYLHLSGNKLSGALPPCLGNIISLQELYLDSNSLTSEIPSSFWNLKDILKVNLSSNLLVGNLSLRIENLKALTLLDLSRNHISGIIPITLGGLINLQNLSLAINKLQGNIPKSFGNLLSLVDLDLSQNNLSGEIPKSLGSLKYLKYVNLSYNKLQGEIPSGGVFKNLTAESFMMNEALCGNPQLQVPPCRKGTRIKSMAKLLLLKCILPLVVSTILVVSCIIFLQRKQPNSRDLARRELSTLGVPKRISYFQILEATNGFDESNLLGRGSYGSVFKGKLSNGMTVAIKIFNVDSEVMARSFEVECDIMRNVHHHNLVKIISSCSNVNFKSLIMEFMPNGSLEKWLYSHNYYLDFLQRLNVMINVAIALEYLHHGLLAPVVHCDLKPSNILLDGDMIAHLSDFGISKLLDGAQSKSHTETIPTVGYIAPEYGSSGVVSTKVDVYSYGIILLEVFTRKKPTEDVFVSGLSLKSWVSESMRHSMMQVMDSNLLQGDEQHIGNILTSTSLIFKLALNCCTDFPETRRNMKDIVVALNKIKVMFMKR